MEISKENLYFTLTSSVSIEFSSQRDVAPPTNWMNADIARSDGWRQPVSYHTVSVTVCTEYLKTKSM